MHSDTSWINEYKGKGVLACAPGKSLRLSHHHAMLARIYRVAIRHEGRVVK